MRELVCHRLAVAQVARVLEISADVSTTVKADLWHVLKAPITSGTIKNNRAAEEKTDKNVLTFSRQEVFAGCKTVRSPSKISPILTIIQGVTGSAKNNQASSATQTGTPLWTILVDLVGPIRCVLSVNNK